VTAGGAAGGEPLGVDDARRREVWPPRPFRLGRSRRRRKVTRGRRTGHPRSHRRRPVPQRPRLVPPPGLCSKVTRNPLWREAVARHVPGTGGRIVAELTMVESGRKDYRPQLAAALASCRTHQACVASAKAGGKRVGGRAPATSVPTGSRRGPRGRGRSGRTAARRMVGTLLGRSFCGGRVHAHRVPWWPRLRPRLWNSVRSGALHCFKCGAMRRCVLSAALGAADARLHCGGQSLPPRRGGSR
jgi:hypothetical protein